MKINSNYIKPTIEVINIIKEDIITTSEGPHNPTDDLFGPGKDGVKL